jgi:hypothetical protein
MAIDASCRSTREIKGCIPAHVAYRERRIDAEQTSAFFTIVGDRVAPPVPLRVEKLLPALGMAKVFRQLQVLVRSLRAKAQAFELMG